MTTIWKFPLQPTFTEQRIALPKARLLNVLDIQVQDDQLVVWVLVDLVDHDIPGETLTLRCVGTGHQETGVASWRYVSTVQFRDMVFHWFSAKR